jgi:hypothetical protein
MASGLMSRRSTTLPGERQMTESQPTCPQCSAPLKLREMAIPRPAPNGTPRAVPKRQWICSNEDCMYTANQHVYSLSR